MLGLMRYHSTVGLLAASVPWLFIPAAFWARRRSWIIGFVSYLLPFAGVVLFFRISALESFRLYAAPIQAQPRWIDLVGVIAPLVVIGRGAMLASLYHIPLAPLVLGVAMMVKARRYSLLVIAIAGIALAMCKPLFGPEAVVWLGVSPILWLSIPMVCFSVFAGLGLQGLLEAGRTDRKWILAAGITLGALAIVTLLFAVRYFQVVFGLADGQNLLDGSLSDRYGICNHSAEAPSSMDALGDTLCGFDLRYLLRRSVHRRQAALTGERSHHVIPSIRSVARLRLSERISRFRSVGSGTRADRV